MRSHQLTYTLSDFQLLNIHSHWLLCDLTSLYKQFSLILMHTHLFSYLLVHFHAIFVSTIPSCRRLTFSNDLVLHPGKTEEKFIFHQILRKKVEMPFCWHFVLFHRKTVGGGGNTPVQSGSSGSQFNLYT